MSGWIIGFAVGAVVVVVVVVLLTLLILQARGAARRAEAILAALQTARDHTAALWHVRETNATVSRIVEGAQATREALERRQPVAGATREDVDRP